MYSRQSVKPGRRRRLNPGRWLITYAALDSFRLERKAAGEEWAQSATAWAKAAGLTPSHFSNWKKAGRVSAGQNTLAKLAAPIGMTVDSFLGVLFGKSGLAKIAPRLLDQDDLLLIKDKKVKRAAELGPGHTFAHIAIDAVKGETVGAVLIEDEAVNRVGALGSYAIIDWSDTTPIPGAHYLIALEPDGFAFRRYAEPACWEPNSTNPDAYPRVYPDREPVEIIGAVLHFVTPGRPA